MKLTREQVPRAERCNGFARWDQKHQIGSGTRQIYGTLFDDAWLLEEYINSLIDDLFYYSKNKKGIGAQRLFSGNNAQR